MASLVKISFLSSKKNNMKAGIIFDFDGVVVDSLSSLKDLYSNICNKIKNSSDSIDLESDFNVLNGFTIEEISKYIKEKYAPNLDASYILNLYREELTKIYSNFSIDFKWIEIFERYRNRGVSLSIASGCDTEYIKLVLKNNSISSLFDMVVGGDQVEKGKPHPDVFLKCKKSLGLDDTLIIEDSNNGVKAAILSASKVIKYDHISSANIGRLIDMSLSFNISYLGHVNSVNLDITSAMNQNFSIDDNNRWSKMSAYNGNAYFVKPSDAVNNGNLSVIKGSYKNYRIGVDIPILAVTGMIKNEDGRILVGIRSHHNYQNKNLMDLVPSGTLSTVNALNQINEEWSEESSSNLVIKWVDSISLILDHNSNVLDLLFLSTGNSFNASSLHSTEIDRFKWIDMAEIDVNDVTETAKFMATLMDKL